MMIHASHVFSHRTNQQSDLTFFQITEKYDPRKSPSRSRSLAEIFFNLQKSKAGIQDWSFSDLTLGLYLVYLRQSSTENAETVKGEQIISDSLVISTIWVLDLKPDNSFSPPFI